MGINLKNKKGKVSAKNSSLKKATPSAIRNGFKTLTKQEVESGRSTAYAYLL